MPHVLRLDLNSRRLRLALACLAIVVVLFVAGVDPALADHKEGHTGATTTKQPGEGLGDLLRGIAGPLVWSLGGLSGIAAFFRRDIGLALVVLVITVVLGLFVTPGGQGALEDLTKLLSDALSATT